MFQFLVIVPVVTFMIVPILIIYLNTKSKTTSRWIVDLYNLLYALHVVTSSFLTWDKMMAPNRLRNLTSHLINIIRIIIVILDVFGFI